MEDELTIQPRNGTTGIFWDWFNKNNTAFLSLDSDGVSDEKKEELLDEFRTQLHKYCDQLYFDIGGLTGQEQELTITAEGKKEYFKFVEELIVDAPAIQNWSFTAFMQPRELNYTSNFEDVELKPLEIWFLPLNSKSKPQSIGLRICLPDFEAQKESQWLKAAVFKMLDTILGEKVFALDVDHVEIGVLPNNPEESGMMELKDLSRFIIWKKKKLLAI